MTTPEMTVTAGGALTLGFAAFHLFFWRLFRWRDELARLGFINRRVVPLLNLTVIFFLAALGMLSIVYRVDLVATPLGRALVATLAAFWLARATEQLVYFPIAPRSIALTALFLAGSLLYAVALVG